MLVENHKNCDAIDYFKLFCAFLVVSIHTEPFRNSFWLDNAFGVLTRIAVPFFFVTSAFFFARGTVTWNRCWRYCKRILILYLFWSAVYLSIEIATSKIMIAEVPFIILVRPYFHLWYLHASIVAVILFTALYRLFRENKLLLILIAALTYLLGMLISTYSSVTEAIPVFRAIADSGLIKLIGTKNGLFYGFPFFVAGAVLSANESNRKISQKMMLLVICLLFIVLAAEGLVAVKLLHVKQTILWFSAMPLTISIFLFVQQTNLPHTGWAVFSRKCATTIYCVHPILIMLLDGRLTNPVLLCLMTFVLSLAIAAICQLLRTNFAVGKHFSGE